MEDDELELLASVNIIDENDPSLMKRKELIDGWGSVSNFMLSYNLKPWKLEDCDEAKNISRSFKEADQEDLKALASAEEAMPPLTLECCFYCKEGKSACSLCSKCKLVKYCSVECQKKSWAQHKLACAPPAIEIAASVDFEAIQLLFRNCTHGAVFQFGEGVLKQFNEKKMVEARRRQSAPGNIQTVTIPVTLPLIIRKSISLIGSCKATTVGLGEETILPFSIIVEVDECEKKGGKLLLSYLVVNNYIHVKKLSIGKLLISDLVFRALS